MKKTCNKCNFEKETNLFSKDKSTKDGLQYTCKECRNKSKNEWRIANKKYVNEYGKNYLLLNPIKKANYIEQNNEYKKTIEFKEKRTIRQRNYIKNRIKEDNVFLLRRNISTLIRNYFKSKKHTKKSKTQDILGCSFEEFKNFIESKFESWMTWDNYGKYNGMINFGWDIDHIIPLSSAETENDVVRLNHYTNLQPLCSKINRDIKKDNK